VRVRDRARWPTAAPPHHSLRPSRSPSAPHLALQSPHGSTTRRWVVSADRVIRWPVCSPPPPWIGPFGDGRSCARANPKRPGGRSDRRCAY
jgi:hypothetical protein